MQRDIALAVMPYAPISVMPHPSLGYRGDLTNLGVNSLCIEARYIVKSALCSHQLIGVPPPIYMGFDHRLTNLFDQHK